MHSSGTHSTQRQRKNISESDYDIYSEFNRLPSDTLIRKSRASVFFRTELDEVIEDMGIDSIVLVVRAQVAASEPPWWTRTRDYPPYSYKNVCSTGTRSVMPLICSICTTSMVM